MLKDFKVRRAVETCYWAEEEETDSDIPTWNENSAGEPSIGEQLSEDQVTRLKELLDNYSDVMRRKPGRTSMAEH